jgi:hypothetical protein
MKLKVFLIRADNDKEAVMRLPVDQYGGITHKGMQLIGKRFYDGSTGKTHWLKYAVCLEAFTNGEDIIQAIESYYSNTI